MVIVLGELTLRPLPIGNAVVNEDDRVAVPVEQLLGDLDARLVHQ